MVGRRVNEFASKARDEIERQSRMMKNNNDDDDVVGGGGGIDGSGKNNRPYVQMHTKNTLKF